MAEHDGYFETPGEIYVPFTGWVRAEEAPEAWEYYYEPEPEPQPGGARGGPNWPPNRTGFAGLFDESDIPPTVSNSSFPVPRRFIEYRSFRYVDPNGRCNPGQVTSLWGAVCHRSTVDAFARRLRVLRSRPRANVDLRQDVTGTEREEARLLLRAFCFPLFLADRASMILESITPWHGAHGMFLQSCSDQRILDLLAALCHHRVHVDSTVRGKPAPRLPLVLVNGRGLESDPLAALSLSPGKAYSMLLTMILDPGRSDFIVGLNFLTGSDIPKMVRPDPFFKFPGSRGYEMFDLHTVG